MKNFVVMFGLIISLSSCWGQNKKDVIAEIFKSRAKYVTDSIPDTFLFHYSPFAEMNHNQIIDSLVLNFPKSEVINNTIYCIEFIPDDYRSRIKGVFWTDSIILSYKWDELKSNMELVSGESLPVAMPFIQDVEEFNSNVTNRSYRWTSIAGAWYAFCSKVKVTNDDMCIVSNVFRVYDKNHFEFYLKEKADNNFRLKKTQNPKAQKKVEFQPVWESGEK